MHYGVPFYRLHMGICEFAACFLSDTEKDVVWSKMLQVDLQDVFWATWPSKFIWQAEK